MEAGTTQESTTSMKALILMKGGQEERSKVLEEMGLGRESIFTISFVYNVYTVISLFQMDEEIQH